MPQEAKAVLAFLGAILAGVIILIGALMGVVTVYQNIQAEQTKQRCLEIHMKPVPRGGSYWCE